MKALTVTLLLQIGDFTYIPYIEHTSSIEFKFWICFRISLGWRICRMGPVCLKMDRHS